MLGLIVSVLALVIDISSARVRASTLQRISDSAALAATLELPDLNAAQEAATEVLARNDPSGTATVTVNTLPGKPGRIEASVVDTSVKSVFLKRSLTVRRSSYAEQAVAIPMGTPYNSIGTGDLPGFVPGSSTAVHGYFLAINGHCTAKEDGDRFMSMFDGIRGSLAEPSGGRNTDAYHCADFDATGHLWTDGPTWEYSGTNRSQWKNNTEHLPGGYSFLVNVPCDGGTMPCPAGTPISTPVFIDAWDPFFLAWQGTSPCTTPTEGTSPSCVVDKVPIANPDNNWNAVGMAVGFFRTKMAIYPAINDSEFSTTAMATKDFGATDVKWRVDNLLPATDWPCNYGSFTVASGMNAYCKNWYPVNDSGITASGRYRVQVVTDPAIPSDGGLRGLKINAAGLKWDGGRSIGINAYALRVRQAATASTDSFTACTTQTSPSCPTITGDGALSVYVRTPGSADLFLSQMTPANDYRGRTVQIQLFDPGEGASRIKILMPTASGYVPVPFSYSTADPGLADYTTGTPVQDRSIGWSGGSNAPVPVSAADGIDVSGTYAESAPPWPVNQRYSQFKFNGRLLVLDVPVPSTYGLGPSGNELTPAQLEGGWWKIRYESATGVEDRTTWVVTSGGGPARLTVND